MRWRAWVATATWPVILSTAAGLAAVLWVSTLLLGRVDGLSAPPYDLAFFQQIVWNVGEHGWWESSFHQGSFLGLHYSPILVVPALVERFVWPDVRVLSLFHASAVGALVPATFLFLRAALRPSRAAGALAAALAVGLPIWGSIQDVIRSDFHPEVAGVVLALLAGWAGLTRRPRAMWALGLLALTTREDVAYAVAVIGLVVAARGRGDLRRHGRVLAATAVAWAIIVFGVLMPWIRGGFPSDTDRYYAWLGGGLNVLAAPFTMTDVVATALTRPAPWFVVAGMVASLVGLPLLRPRWALLVVFPLVALLLSANTLQATVRLQYSMILIVPLLVAAGLGGRRAIAHAARLERRWIRRRGWPKVGHRTGSSRSGPIAPRALLVLATIPALAGAWLQGSLPPFDFGDPAFFQRPAAIERLQLAVADVPAQARLLADEGLIAPLAGRAQVGRLAGATPADDAYILIDRLAWSPTIQLASTHSRLAAKLEAAGSRPILADDGRFILWGPQGDEGPP